MSSSAIRNGVLLVLALVVAQAFWSNREQRWPPGILAAADPRQGPTQAPAFEYHGAQLQPLATFALTARVLSRTVYRFDSLAELIPVDLALGWGRMSDSAVVDQIEVRQGLRFYEWRVRTFPIPEQEIISHSANMHMLPADSAVDRRLRKLRTGQLVHLEGLLVSAKLPDGRVITSSTRRDDSGAGACEVMWVSSVALEAQR